MTVKFSNGESVTLYDVLQYAEDTRFYFSTTHKGQTVEVETDMMLVQGAYLPCVVLDGPDKGDEIYRPVLMIVAMWEKQQEESSNG
tara:strand:- start:299 stop:556 length:258 start_codon:yes stop_codon:yes gene_type:complete